MIRLWFSRKLSQLHLWALIHFDTATLYDSRTDIPGSRCGCIARYIISYVTIRELVDRLADLPAQKDPRWGISAHRMGDEASEEDLAQIYGNQSIDVGVRFAAFYLVQTRLRQRREYDKFKENVTAYFSDFEHQPMFIFMRAESYGDVTGDSASRELAIEFARLAADELPDTPGISHLLAEYLLESVEIGVSLAPGPSERERLREAETAVNRAISLSGGTYPKYHATKGRILTALGSEEAAIVCLNKAISLEDASTPKGEARIQAYQGFRREVTSRRNTRLLLEQQQQAVSEFRALRGELLSLLGLLAAVVAFISTSTNIANSLPLRQAIVVQLNAAGGIIIVFWVFALLFAQNSMPRKSYWVVLVGAVLIGASITLSFLYS